MNKAALPVARLVKACLSGSRLLSKTAAVIVREWEPLIDANDEVVTDINDEIIMVKTQPVTQ